MVIEGVSIVVTICGVLALFCGVARHTYQDYCNQREQARVQATDE